MSAWTPWRVGLINYEHHVVDERGKTSCGTRGTVFVHGIGATCTITCLGCRKVLGDLRQDCFGWGMKDAALIHVLEPTLQVATGTDMSREPTWRFRCTGYQLYFQDLEQDPWGKTDLTTTCLACLAVGRSS